jgi:uroporphyrinogen decarboxylase
MTSRELVQRTLRFEATPRVPRHLWAGPLAETAYPDELAAIRRDFPDDIIGPDLTLPPIDGMRGDPNVVGEFVDEWGCTFVNLLPNIMGEVKVPQIQRYETDLDQIRPPWQWVDIDRDAVNRSCGATDRFVVLLAPIRPFERMQFLRGTENVLMDILRKPDGFLRCAIAFTNGLAHCSNNGSKPMWTRSPGMTTGARKTHS